jgi:hypothetical protein
MEDNRLPVLCQVPGKGFYAGSFVQNMSWKLLKVKLLPYLQQKIHAQQRVTPQVKEIVVNTDIADGKELFPDARHFPLTIIARSDIRVF